MKIHPDSWHAKLYRLHRARSSEMHFPNFESTKCLLTEAKNLDICRYFNAVFFGSLVHLAFFSLIAFFVVRALGLVLFNPIPFLAFAGLLIGCLATIVGVLFGAQWVQNAARRASPLKDKKPRKDSLIVERVKAFKSKTCVLVEIEDE